MTLELNQMTRQVQEMAEALAARLRQMDARLEELRALLHEHAQPDEALRAKVRQARALGWIGAEPGGEPLDLAHPAPPLPSRISIIAADGSQIHPDRHAAALYYVINVGAILYRRGSGAAPEVFVQPALHFEEDEDETGTDDQPFLVAEVDARRDLEELKLLAEKAEAERAALGGDLDAPIVALADGPLMLLRTLYEATRQEQRQQVSRHAQQLARLQAAHVPVAGYIDRPGSALVTRLLRLAQLDKPAEALESHELRARDRNDPPDRLLFRFLKPGERSALFYNTSRINDDYEGVGQRIAFFYMNVGGEEGGQIGRVEVPAWVAADPAKIGLIQAALYDQSQVTGGYPYVLARAHELAVITAPERAKLDEMVNIALLGQGLAARLSHKAQLKILSSGSRRRYGR